jgi:hypothetical protein
MRRSWAGHAVCARFLVYCGLKIRLFGRVAGYICFAVAKRSPQPRPKGAKVFCAAFLQKSGTLSSSKDAGC